jgi:outer membrane protein OmpA-like peptidoglycan-associated protein
MNRDSASSKPAASGFPGESHWHLESPFAHEPIDANREEDSSPRLSKLLDESPFVRLLGREQPFDGSAPSHNEDEPAETECCRADVREFEDEDVTLDEEAPGCADEETSFTDETGLSVAEIWTASADQISFRDRVLAAHLARSRAARGSPKRDLSDDALTNVPGTGIRTSPETAAAAGRLLAAANADLAQAQQSGDVDALLTIRLTATSGYRGSKHQKDLWIQYFSAKGGYYDRTQAARERLADGPHSDAAVDYMLKSTKAGGFGLGGRIAAPGYSNHQGGIAIDFWQARKKDHRIRNKSTDSERAKWRASWFHAWLRRNAATFGFQPIPSEEWHWEYRSGSATQAAAPKPAEASRHLGGKLWTFAATTLPLPVSVYCPQAAISQPEVDLLVYAHGLLDRCEGPHTVPGIITQEPFKLARIVSATQRAVVLVVPHLGWQDYKGAHPLGTPARLNGVLAEVLTELGRAQSSAAPAVRELILAGHSRAYGVLEPLARAHADRDMQRGTLAKLSQVWAFDTTYAGRVDDWMAWLDANPRLAVSVFYRPGSAQQRAAGKKLTWAVGDEFYRRRGGRLRVEQAPEKHCDVPPTRLPGLLARSPSPQQETEDLADLEDLAATGALDAAETYGDIMEYADDTGAEAELDDGYAIDEFEASGAGHDAECGCSACRDGARGAETDPGDELSTDDLLSDVAFEPEDAPTDPEARAEASARTASTSQDEAIDEVPRELLDEAAGAGPDNPPARFDAENTSDTGLFVSAPTSGPVAQEAPTGQAAQRCQRKWVAEVAAYPVEVRNAIANAPTHGALDVYLWAVRKGVRDEAKLRRLLYFTLYGYQHGYCDPATRAATTAWNDVATSIRAYRKWPQPPRAQAGAEPCSSSSAQPVPRDKPALDITGRYYTMRPSATFVINQAGQHIEGVASYVLDSSSAKSGDHRQVTEFQGDLHGRRYQWFDRDRPGNFGQIGENNGQLFIAQGVGANNETIWEQLRPIEKRPTLIRPGDLNRSFDLIDRYELTPLTPEQMKFVRLILDKGKLEQIFELYFNRQKRDEALAFLMRRFVGDPGQAPYVPRLEKFHSVDLPLVREYARQVLTLQKWKQQRNLIRSHGDWIQMMLDRTLRPGALRAPDFKRYLGFDASPQRAQSEGEHTYEFTIELTGASFMLAGYTGTVSIEKTGAGKRWQRTFDIDLWGANAAVTLFDAKIGSKLKGAARSYVEWTENDVPGAVRIFRAGASIGMDAASAQAGFMHVLGDESLPPLDVFFQEAGLGVPNVMKILEDGAKAEFDRLRGEPGSVSPKGVLGLDITVSALFGSISPAGSLLERLRKVRKAPDVIDLSRDVKSDVSVARSLSSQTHFCLGSDRLTEAAVQALRIMCARELPLLMSPQSHLLVIGHADTLGRGRYDNKALSGRRAKNTIQAIRDVLGAKFGLKDDGTHIKAVAAGDELAARESRNKATPAPKHRRVQVFLNSVLVLTLFGSSGVP